MGRVFNKIYEVVKRIPKGKVATYGQIGKLVGTSPRVVGNALHANCDRVCPCHRVVGRNGRLAPNYGFSGWMEQKRKLISEGVKFKDKRRVDLNKFLISNF